MVVAIVLSNSGSRSRKSSNMDLSSSVKSFGDTVSLLLIFSNSVANSVGSIIDSEEDLTSAATELSTGMFFSIGSELASSADLISDASF